VRKHKTPLYPVLLQLKNIHPNAWQRAVLGEGMALVGALLALADVASAWSIIVLPVVVAVVVKAHDLLAGLLHRTVESNDESTVETADVVTADAEPTGNVSVRRTG
jgi:hypothetical protein